MPGASDSTYGAPRQTIHALELAQNVFSSAETELKNAQAELSQLELELAHVEHTPQPNGENSLKDLAGSMMKVLTEMKACGSVPTGSITEAESQMQILMNGIRMIAAAVAESAQTQRPPKHALSPDSKAEAKTVKVAAKPGETTTACGPAAEPETRQNEQVFQDTEAAAAAKTSSGLATLPG